MQYGNYADQNAILASLLEINVSDVIHCITITREMSLGYPSHLQTLRIAGLCF